MKHARRTFSLVIVPEEGNAYRLDMFATTNGHSERVIGLSGSKLDRLRSAVLGAVTDSKHARTVLSPTRKAPIELTEDAGVRLALIALAAAPVRKASRVEAIRHGVDAMTGEEALYWYALVTGPNASRALQALRLLLAEE